MTQTGIPVANGALGYQNAYFQKYYYDMGNLSLLAQGDGCCGISRFAKAGRENEVFVPNSFYCVPTLSGIAASATSEKEVAMLGRMQTVQFSIGKTKITCETFLEEAAEAIYQIFTVRNDTEQWTTLKLDFGMLLGGLAFPEVSLCRVPDGFQLRTCEDSCVYVICNGMLSLREIQDKGVHMTASLDIAPRELAQMQLVFSLQETSPEAFAARDNAIGYGNWLASCAPRTLPARYLDEFVSCLNCGISCFKQTADFEGFYAGVSYKSPARTYYRDSFFTAIAVLPYRPDLVRRELAALAYGIGPEGKCPSAVQENGGQFWPDHLDSPQYFILLLSAYSKASGDKAFLQVEVAGKSMLSHARFLADTLLEAADSNGLLYRHPGNRHDWADNVFREGYVTYIQALFCQAVKSVGELLLSCGIEGGEHYIQKAANIANAIEKLLWCEEKGWYVNYLSHDCTENNLSIDTVLLAWWNIARPERSLRMLENMERLLETQNNGEQSFGDWGTMCCWPPYQWKSHLVEKSSYDYVYHNGSDWPFWSSVYAITKTQHAMDGEYPATRWFDIGLQQGNYTPVEYFNPLTGSGGLLQAWSAMGTLALSALASASGDLKNPQ